MKCCIVIGLAILLLGFSGCSGSRQTAVVAAAPVPGEAGAQPSSVPKESVFVASGPVVVENQVDVAALREGLVVSILAQPGTMTHKGQSLAKLDDRQISADVEAAAAKVRSIEANLKNWEAETNVLRADRSRAEKLFEAHVISKEELEHAQYKEESDEYEVQREAESLNNAKAVLKSVRLCSLAESLGGVETLISHPATMTHASVPLAQRQRLGITDGLVRISAGIEDIEDLIADLDLALAKV